MTPADKASFLETTKRALLLEQGVPWEVIEPKIQAEIDATFDDAQFVKMDPDSRIDAAYATLGSDPIKKMLKKYCKNISFTADV